MSADYIYLPDECCDRHECSRCGEPVFAGMSRRETHDEWIKVIEAHKRCKSPDEQERNP